MSFHWTVNTVRRRQRARRERSMWRMCYDSLHRFVIDDSAAHRSPLFGMERCIKFLAKESPPPLTQLLPLEMNLIKMNLNDFLGSLQEFARSNASTKSIRRRLEDRVEFSQLRWRASQLLTAGELWHPGYYSILHLFARVESATLCRLNGAH